MRLLVLDAYAPEGRQALRDAGGTEAGRLYQRLLETLAPGTRVERAYPADPGFEVPAAAELARFDGAVWTGSSLTIHRQEDPRVRVQVALQQALSAGGIPSFGSCWAAQLAVVGAGGRCAPSPRGREFGVSRAIALSPRGSEHPLFAGKPARFDAFTSHEDEVVALGSAECLAGNAWSAVQAVSVESGPGRFWAVQYHPEYDCHEVASLCRLRSKELVAQGHFADEAEGARYVDDLESLHRAAEGEERRALADRLDLDESVLDPALRTLEVRNWLRSLEDGPPGKGA